MATVGALAAIGELNREDDECEQREEAEVVRIAHDALDATIVEHLEELVARPVEQRGYLVESLVGVDCWGSGSKGRRITNATKASKSRDAASTNRTTAPMRAAAHSSCR